MLSQLKVWFENRTNVKAEDQGAGDQLQLAAAVLLIEVSKADFEQQLEEQGVILKALKLSFDLSDADAEDLMRQASDTSNDSTYLQQFTRLLNEHCSQEEKIYLLEQLWRVAFADGRLDKYEDYMIRKLADLLYISHREFIQAKHKVESDVSN